MKQKERLRRSFCFNARCGIIQGMIFWKTSAGLISLFALFVFLGMSVFAQSADDVVARRAKLESDLKVLESQIEAQKEIIEGKRSQAQTLERDIAIFDAKIKETDLRIRARDLSIQKLTRDIADKQKTITGLSAKLTRELESLAQIIRKTDQIEDITLPELVMGRGTVSEVFSDIDRFKNIGEALNKSYNVVQEDKQATEEEKKSLEEKKIEETQLRSIQALEKKRIEQNKAEKAKILKETRGQEAEYQKILAARQKDAAAIRSELFTLQGSKAISFEKAYEYALFVQQKTGVRPAFLLGIITEETNLGENLGSGNWRIDMHPTRDLPIFKYITESLGLNPDSMPISKKPWYGYGGAMGPAQFIPSTWVCFAGYLNVTTGKCGKDLNGKTWTGPWEYNSAKDRIGALTGNNPPNPWEPKDAFVASGLLLKDNGAAAKTSRAEFISAMCYLAGCGNVNNKSLQFYGDDVMCLALKYQRSIDILDGTNVAASREGDIYHTQCL